MDEIDRGCLVLADISGYSSYLAGVELTHSKDLLADLLGTIAAEAKGRFCVSKIEGDAVFFYEDGAADASGLVNFVEGCYFAFARRRRDIAHLTTCRCDACARIPDLDLKVVAHHGEFAHHRIAGHDELVGPEVVAVHRLLKNGVIDETGIRSYALYTDGATAALGFDVGAMGLIEHHEAVDDVGPVSAWIDDLAVRWGEEQTRTALLVDAASAAATIEVTLDAPPSVVWDHLSDPTKRQAWNGADRIDEENPRGVRGVGTTSHCVHGKQRMVERVIDWRPEDYVTIEVSSRGLVFLVSFELTAFDGNRTLLAARVKALGGAPRRALFRVVGPKLRSLFEQNLGQLAALLAADAADQVSR